MNKGTERMTSVLFTPYRANPIDVNLRFKRRELKWEMEIKAHGQSRTRIPVDINTEYLNELNRRLREAASKAIHHADIGGSLAEQERQSDLIALAKEGSFAFTEIFANDDAREIIEDLMASEKPLAIEVESDDFSIPWELLYSDNSKKPSYEKFWGMKYIISRLIEREEGKGKLVSPTICVKSRPKLGLFALKNSSLPSIAKKEIPFFQTLKKNGKISLRQLPGLDPTPANKESEINKFKQFLNKPFDVAHFACHAHYDEEKNLESFIQLSKGIRISLFDLKQEPTVSISDSPLVVLNACKMGKNNPMDVRSFAGDFIKYGALGVVATEAAVPDDLAADFTRHLYKYFLNEELLGKSVLLARKELLAQGNPVGLLYALYAPHVTKLELPKQKQKQKQKRTKNIHRY